MKNGKHIFNMQTLQNYLTPETRVITILPEPYLQIQTSNGQLEQMNVVEDADW